jgi:hypothetical protein
LSIKNATQNLQKSMAFFLHKIKLRGAKNKIKEVQSPLFYRALVRFSARGLKKFH